MNPWAFVAAAYDPVMRLAGWRRVQARFAAGVHDVLDVGCGTAWLSETIGASYTGMDRELRMVRRTGRTARVVVGDARALPFADNSFEVVLSTGFLGLLSLPDRSLALAEMARVTHGELRALEPIRGVTRAKALALSARPVDLDEFRAAGFCAHVGTPVYFGVYAPVVATLVR